MTERKRTKTEERSHIEMMIELNEMERWIKDHTTREKLIPPDWSTAKMDTLAPVTPEKAKVTLRLGKRTVTFFRKMGTGWHERMNAVLRTYMLALISKHIEGEFDRDWKGDLI